MLKPLTRFNFIDKRTGKRMQYQATDMRREAKMLMKCADEVQAALEANDNEALRRAHAKLFETNRVVREYLYSGPRAAIMERLDDMTDWREARIGEGTAEDFVSNADLWLSLRDWCIAKGRAREEIPTQNVLTRWIARDPHVHAISKRRRGVYGLTLLPLPDEPAEIQGISIEIPSPETPNKEVES